MGAPALEVDLRRGWFLTQIGAEDRGGQLDLKPKPYVVYYGASRLYTTRRCAAATGLAALRGLLLGVLDVEGMASQSGPEGPWPTGAR